MFSALAAVCTVYCAIEIVLITLHYITLQCVISGIPFSCRFAVKTSNLSETQSETGVQQQSGKICLPLYAVCAVCVSVLHIGLYFIHGRRNREVWGTMGPAGYRGGVQWKWSLLLQQTVFIQFCTGDWISTPLALVDTCQVNDIWKDGLGRVSTAHPHCTAALFKSTCQHAHAAVNWLSMSLSRHTCQLSLTSFTFLLLLH